MKQLSPEGVFVFRNLDKSFPEEKYLLAIKNEVIGAGDAGTMIRTVTDILRSPEKTVTQRLQSFMLTFRKSRSVVNTGARLGEDATEQSIRSGTVRVKEHPDFETQFRLAESYGVKVIEMDDWDLVSLEIAAILDGKKIVRVEKIMLIPS